MIRSRELLEKGWKRDDEGFWRHPKCWMRDVKNGEDFIVTHTLAQARWAQEHILDKE